MAIIKKYSNDNQICHVTFILPREIGDNYKQVSLVGDFNDWDIEKDKFSHKNSEGLLTAEYNLEVGKEYQFRYLCDEHIWINEPEADRQVLTHFGDSENSVIAT